MELVRVQLFDRSKMGISSRTGIHDRFYNRNGFINSSSTVMCLELVRNQEMRSGPVTGSVWIQEQFEY